MFRAGTPVSRLMLLRVTETTLKLARTYGDLLAVAYPAKHVDAISAIVGTARWPGPALVWMDATKGVAVMRDTPPRGITLGR